MNEPTLLFCTVRDGVDEWHIECRFSDGQKFAAITVDREFQQLADLVASLLNQRAAQKPGQQEPTP